MTHDTWTFELAELEPLLGGSTSPADAGSRRRAGDRSDAPARARGAAGAAAAHDAMCRHEPRRRSASCAPLRRCPIADRRSRTARADDDRGGERDPGRSRTPTDHRYAVTARGPMRGAEARAALRDIWRSCPPSTRSRSGTAGRRPAAAGHGVLGRGQRLHRHVRDLARPGRRRAAPRWVAAHTTALAAVGKGVYLGDTDFTRRSGPVPGGRQLSAAGGDPGRRDPDGGSAPT